MSDTSHYFATRYDSAADEVIAVLSDEMEGFGTAHTGEVDSPTGYVSLVILDNATQDLDFANYPADDHAGEVAREFGVTADDVVGNYVVRSTDQGFVYVHAYDTPDLAREAYLVLDTQYAAWCDTDEEN